MLYKKNMNNRYVFLFMGLVSLLFVNNAMASCTATHYGSSDVSVNYYQATNKAALYEIPNLLTQTKPPAIHQTVVITCSALTNSNNWYEINLQELNGWSVKSWYNLQGLTSSSEAGFKMNISINGSSGSGFWNSWMTSNLLDGSTESIGSLNSGKLSVGYSGNTSPFKVVITTVTDPHFILKKRDITPGLINARKVVEIKENRGGTVFTYNIQPVYFFQNDLEKCRQVTLNVTAPKTVVFDRINPKKAGSASIRKQFQIIVEKQKNACPYTIAPSITFSVLSNANNTDNSSEVDFKNGYKLSLYNETLERGVVFDNAMPLKATTNNQDSKEAYTFNANLYRTADPIKEGAFSAIVRYLVEYK